MFRGPAPLVFVNEDVSKTENRLNLAILALLTVAPFRLWFLRNLALPEDSAVYPPQNIHGNLRPDYVVTSPDREFIHAWIELELGEANAKQLAKYRDALDQRVISIVGAGRGGDLTLQDIASYVAELLPALDPQAQVVGEMVTTLVSEWARQTKLTDYTDPDDQLRERPAIQALLARLGDIIGFGPPPVPRGRLKITTITQEGWSLRAFARGAKNKSIALMFCSSDGTVRLHSIDALRYGLPEADVAIGDYANAIERHLNIKLGALEQWESEGVPEGAVVDALDDLAPIIRRLAGG